MSWGLWIAGAIIAWLPGAWALRSGKSHVARAYMIACGLLILAWVFGLGSLAGPAYAPWPKYLFFMLAPGTLLLMIATVQNDRKRVMGATQADRDALATAAVLYGAGQHQSGEAAGDLGDTGGGDG